MSQQRHLAAILFTDIVGYTALMQENEQRAVALIKHYNSSLNTIVAQHEGKVLNYYGDGSLCTFPSATEAVNCAVELQKELQSYPNVPLRIGLHIGEVLFEDGKAIGDGVNVASRIQSLGQANTILFSKEFHDKVKNHPEFNAVSLGMFEFKNVEDPVEVFALANDGLVVPNKEQMSGKLKKNGSKRKYLARRNGIVWISVFVLLTAGILLYLNYFRHQKNAIGNSIAVIPFTNMSTDPNQEFFAEGVMDEILNHLYKIGGLNVISRTSSMVYKDTKKNSKEIANELGVANLLEGSVQKDGDHIKITAQLIDGKKDEHIWAESYDREFKDVFSIESEIAQLIAASLKVKIDPDVKVRIESIPTQNTEAYSLFIRGINDSTPLEQRKLLLETAIVLDSTFADAFAALSIYWLLRGNYSGDLTSEEVLKNAEPLLQRAIHLNPNLGYAYEVNAIRDLWYKWDFSGVGNDYERARLLSPSKLEIIPRFADYLLAIGKFDEALDVTSKAFEKDSSSNQLCIALSMANYFRGKSKNALQIIERNYFKRKDLSIWTNYIRINVYASEYNKAVKVFEQDKVVWGPNYSSLVFGYSAIAYYRTGYKDSTEKFLNILKARSEKSHVGSPSYFIAAIYTAMGDYDQAIKWLQKAYNDHEVEMYWLKVEPLFISLHNDPRFKEILAKIGFK